LEVTIPVENDDGSVKFDVTMTPEQHKAILKFGLSMALGMGLAAQLLGPETAALLEDDNEELDD